MQDKSYIFGAHPRARTLAYYLKYLNHQTEIKAFLFDNDEKNPEVADGIPVVFLDEKNSKKMDTNLPVYIATRGVYHKDIKKHLEEVGFKTIIPVTPAFDSDIRNRFLKGYYKNNGESFEKIDEIVSEKCDFCSPFVRGNSNHFCVYVAKTAFDKNLVDCFTLPEYSKYIQVGAALTDKRINESGEKIEDAQANNKIAILDNSGENISEKNKEFCELTALYWIWKNSEEMYVGLEHYRRHFILPDNWQQTMIDQNIDVILPIPLYVMPNLEENYRMRHISEDLDFVFEYINENYPEDINQLKAFFNKGLYSPCNMFIAKKPVFDRYCEWVFPILFALNEHVGSRQDSYQNRYPGFIAERLMSFFFTVKEKDLKIVYSDKNFLD